MLRTITFLLLALLLLSPLHSHASGPVQLVQGKCPDSNKLITTSQKGLASKATLFVSSLIATQDAKSWQILTVSPLKKGSPYYSPAVSACKQKVAANSFLVDILVTKQSGKLPVRMHLFAAKETTGWIIWGLTTY
ncbi:hypothetical protein [Pseudalkalibacillus hwajinpoensis]|uniref:Uncharacterized protein n=1 Tax=Guptibacillus hwajinpoensis TaxID=208199 RepID=A0A4U1MPV3_9BACL|nr:hypothetical protein [Pseudalkalibacillus hwajinpoensis]TKD72570.1 hypothetical protein FBF83_07280 [Pseudalkalibacillus hwajinpoensis]